MLRSQSQAAYSPDNIGHFGLALPRYAHFTSPIRRYADLLVHRALIRGLRLGRRRTERRRGRRASPTSPSTSRRPSAAPRWPSARRSTVTSLHTWRTKWARFRRAHFRRDALRAFCHCSANGASGIVPLSSLPDDFWMHDERTQTLTGRRTRLSFRLAQEVEVRLAEASPRHRRAGLSHPARVTRRPCGARRRSGQRSRGPVIRVSVLLALLLAVPPARAQSAPSQSGFEAGLAGEVYVAALAFMAPRILEPVPVSQLTLWGLRGLTALDPRLEVAVGEQGLLLTLGGRLALCAPAAGGRGPPRLGRRGRRALRRRVGRFAGRSSSRQPRGG